MTEVLCKSCGLVAQGDQFPQGWYFLSVVDQMARTGKGYRYLGLFCSVVCLADHLPYMSVIEKEIERRKEVSRRRD